MGKTKIAGSPCFCGLKVMLKQFVGIVGEIAERARVNEIVGAEVCLEQ